MAINTEILVHVDAPSGARDDAGYRSLVESCLAFEPVSRFSIYGEANEGKNDADPDVTVEDLTSSLSSTSGQSLPLPRRNHDETSFGSGDELHSLLESYHSASHDDAQTRNSPRHLAGPAAHTLSTSIQYYSTEEESELPFQAPIPLGYQDSIGNKTESFTKPSQRKSPASSGGSGVQPKHTSPSPPIAQSANTESLTWDTPLDTIPDSQPQTPPRECEDTGDQTELLESVQVDRSYVPDTVRQSKRFRVENSDDNSSSDTNETRIPSSVPSSSPHEPCRLEETSSESPPAKGSPVTVTTQSNSFLAANGIRKRTSTKKNNVHERNPSHGSDYATLATKTVNITTTAAPKQRPQKRQTLPQSTETISLNVLPIEIRAPNPEVSQEKFRTHITPTLQSLADRMKLASRFSPSTQTRDLHPLERGYWFIQHISIGLDTYTDNNTKLRHTDNPAQIWTQAFFSQFWCFLREFLVEGRAGWGVWCLLEACPDPSSSNNTNNQQTDSEPHSANQPPRGIKLVNLKIYTWGEVAPHIYMLLYLATERRIRNIKDVEWRDARDEVVIRM